MRRLAWVVPALLVLSGCLGQGPEKTSPPPTADGHHHAANSTGPKMYVIASDLAADPTYAWRFSPSSYTFHVGDHVNVTLSNAEGDQYQHALVIDELNVHVGPVDVGKKANATFHASKAGAFKYYCNVGNHRTLGMEGTLTIEQ